MFRPKQRFFPPGPQNGDNMQCVVHIGLHKTGTSSIQDWCLANRDRLLDFGVNYLHFARPDFPAYANHSIPLYSLYARDPFGYKENFKLGLNTPAEIRKHNARATEIFEREMAANESRVFVISGEALSSLHPEGVRAFRDDLARHFDDIGILAWVRPPVSLMRSVMSQLVVDSGMTLEKFAGIARRSPRNILQYRKLKNFLEAFGDKAVTVRRYDESGPARRNVVAAFLDFVGATGALEAGEAKKTNASLSAKAVEVFSVLNREVPLYQDGACSPERAALNPLLRVLLAGSGGERARVQPELARSAVMACAEDLAWLRDKTGVDFTACDGDGREGRALPNKGPDRVVRALAGRLAEIVRADAPPGESEQKAVLGLLASLNGVGGIEPEALHALAGIVAYKRRVAVAQDGP
jgi:hypothetical protein